MAQLALGQAAVHLEGPDGGHYHNGGGHKTRCPAFYVKELLRAQIRAEARLGYHIVGGLKRHLGSQHRVAAVGDVGEGTAVDKGGGALKGLDKIGLNGVLQKGGHGALGLQLAAGDGLPFKAVSHHDAGKTLFQIADGAGKAEDGHDLAGNGDVKSVLPGHAVCTAAHAVHQEAELSVIHVETALPGDPAYVDPQGVALLNMIVQHGGKQIVGGTDGVDISGEVEIDVLHGHNLGIAAAAGPALDPKNRAQRGLAHGDDGLLAYAAQRVRKADGGGGLAFPGGSWGDGGHKDQSAPRAGTVLQQRQVDLGLVPAVLLQIVRAYMGLLGNGADGRHCAALRDCNIAEPCHENLSLLIRGNTSPRS